MNREQLEHLIRAAGRIAGVDEVLVIGSQTILGQHPDGLPQQATRSMEADIAFVGALLRHGVIDRDLLVERVNVPEDVDDAVRARALHSAEVLGSSSS